MKTSYFVLAVPLFAFFAAAVTLDLRTLIPVFPESDLTPYLASLSLSHDFDLAYTRGDSDRFFREHLARPAGFALVQKEVLSKNGEFLRYPAFYYPDLYAFFLAPFVRALSYRGIMLFHALLIAALYLLAYLYYARDEGLFPAVNSVLYYTLLPVPILFLIPSHHLFLLSLTTAALFFGIRRRPILCAIFLVLAFSAQPWALLFAVLLISYWQLTGGTDGPSAASNQIQFAVVLLVGIVAIWGIERMMYPSGLVSEAKWVGMAHERPVGEIWNSLPSAAVYTFGTPDAQKAADFFFGRNTGFFVYFFAACGLLLSSVWLWKDALARTSILFTFFFLIALCFSHPSVWNARYFVNDFAILLSALAVFVCPLVRPKAVFIIIGIVCAFTVGPLLANPLGAILSRTYYAQTFPYRLFPVEISLAGKIGTTADPEFRLHYDSGKVYLLNDEFYTEEQFFWIRGESALEVLFETKLRLPRIKIANGSLDNTISLQFGDQREDIVLGPGGRRDVDLQRFAISARWYDGRLYLHGKIKSESGYVPKLLSRDNPDFRFLGCQIHISATETTNR